MIRKVDIVDETIAESKILYEFKSVKEVPPGKFNDQFIKDLSNPDVTDLSQLKWVFDGRKSPANFTSNMDNAINNLPLTKELASKFIGSEDISMFRNYLKSESSNLFILAP